MTVYHNGVEVEVVAGDTNEGWAAVRHEGSESVMDVNIGELGAEGRYEEIEEAIEEANESLDFDFTQYRVRVRYPHERLHVETHGGKTLFYADFFEALDENDDYDFVTEVVMPAIRAVDMANRQPNRLLFRNREELAGVEA